MNFEFSPEQQLLREQARRFLDENCSRSAVRKVLEGSESYDKNLWHGIAELGWLSTRIPEEFGGLGLTHYELCVISEEIGRAVAPVPFSSSVYFATEALINSGDLVQQQRWLPKLATGDAIGTLALAEKAGRPSASNITAHVKPDGLLYGTKNAVPDGDVADFAIVIAQGARGDGLSAYLVELKSNNVESNTLRTIDPTRSHAQLVFDGSNAELLGSEGNGWPLVEKVFDCAAVFFAWEQVGGAQAALDQATEYAKERYAFGRPIGGFQAIKHKLANAYVKNALARSNCYFGTWALAEDRPELAIAAATARVSATQAYYFASKENIQTHGGMGFTWEFDCQFFYRRSKLLSVAIGSEMWWQDRLITAYEKSNRAA